MGEKQQVWTVFPGKVIRYQTLCYFDNPVGIIESPGVVFPVAPYINTGLLVQHWEAAVRANSRMQKMLKLVQTTNICLPARVSLIRGYKLPNLYLTQQSCCQDLVTQLLVKSPVGKLHRTKSCYFLNININPVGERKSVFPLHEPDTDSWVGNFFSPKSYMECCINTP